MAATYSIDGVAADLPGVRQLKAATTWRSSIGTRTTDIQIPGWHGSIPATQDTLEVATLQMVWHVYGEEGDAGALMRRVDDLRKMIGWAKTLRTITRTGETLVDEVQTAQARIKTISEPTVLVAGKLAAITISFEIPGVFWRGEVLHTWTSTAAVNTPTEITPLEGTTAPIGDSILLITGPLTSPAVSTGDGVIRINTPIAAGEQVRINTATWTAARGMALGWTDAGTDCSGDISPSVDTGPALTLAPRASDGAVMITLAGFAPGPGNGLQVRARKAFL